MARKHEAERVSQLVFYGTVLLIAWLAWRIVEPFLVEIGWAVVLAICLGPARVRLEPRLGRTRTAALLTAAVVVLLVIPVVFVGAALVSEGRPAVAYLEAQLQSGGGASAWLHRGWEWARARAPFLPTEQEVIAKVTASVGLVAEFLSRQAGGLLKGALSFLFSLVITLGLLFFLVRDAEAFSAALGRVLPFGKEQNARLLSLGRELVSASVTATLAIAALQGLIGGVTFALLGISGAALWGSMMGILALLPLVGATLVWLPAAVWLALSGSLVKGIVLAAVGVLVLGNVDNVVRPLLLSGKSQMNTLVLIISLMGGVSAFGFIGIVLGPLVAAILTALVESYHQEPEPVAAASGPADGPVVAAVAAEAQPIPPPPVVPPAASPEPPAVPPAVSPKP
jgi:predicted PurR-regulated permease PerM